MSSLNHIPTYRFAASVLEEMKNLVHQVTHPESTKLVFQSLPKHMRRRAMSHHPKRLPRKYRAAHSAQMSKSGKPKTPKRPSRKYRRRARNLMLAYERRQRHHKWLETHLWHARRFHMIDRWGYRLPYASCDKTFRACYRASAEHCLVQDLSYMACIEMQGLVSELEQGFRRLTSDYDNVTAKRYRSGRFEGCMHFYKDNCYPNDAISVVNFMWKPRDSVADDSADKNKHTLWLWVHPAIYDTLFNELAKVFNLEVKEKEKAESGATPACSRKSCPPSYENTRTHVKLVDLRDVLLRFRLTGARSQDVLANVLKAYSIQNDETHTRLVGNSEETTDSNWFRQSLIKDISGSLKELHDRQVSAWNKITNFPSPSMVPSNCILGLIVQDPRISRPSRRTKAQISKEPYEENLLDSVNDSYELYAEFMEQRLSESILWKLDSRNLVTNNMLSIHKYNEMRAKHAAVSGLACVFEKHLQPLPIILIQRPGAQDTSTQRLGYGSGWDIIAPPGYGMALWQSMIMWGAKAGGLRESESVARESGIEMHSPDTVLGKRLANEAYTSQFATYFRRPPSRRPNYRKLSIISPFRAPFTELVNDWRPEGISRNNDSSLLKYYILRDPKVLRRLNAVNASNWKLLAEEFAPDNYNCLVPVRLVAVGRGTIENNAIICIPLKQDIYTHQKNAAQSLKRQAVCAEPKRIDTNESLRKKALSLHCQRLKRLRRLRVKEKHAKQRTSNFKVRIRPANTAPIVSEHFREMCRLWLPNDYSEQFRNVRKQCSREVVGYITSGGQSLVEGRSAGCGFIALEGFKALLEAILGNQSILSGIHCLVRNAKSRHYYLAKLKINVAQ